MVRTMRGHLTTLQSEGKYKSETILNASQQEGHRDATEGRDIADYDPDIDYGGSEPKVEPATKEQREVDPDAD